MFRPYTRPPEFGLFTLQLNFYAKSLDKVNIFSKKAYQIAVYRAKNCLIDFLKILLSSLSTKNLSKCLYLSVICKIFVWPLQGMNSGLTHVARFAQAIEDYRARGAH